jgi:hypothetical protein
MSQEITNHRRGGPRGPVMERTVGGRVMLTPGASAKSLGYSLPHFNRLRRNGRLSLKQYFLSEGGLPRYAEDEIEALKK